MIVPSPKTRRLQDDNILPLINVVFLLLIFFVIAGAITRSAPFDLTLPTTARTQDRATPADKVLSVAAGGRLAFAGEPVEAAELKEMLADWPQHQPLQIRADRGLNASTLTRLLERLREAGIASVLLLTEHQG